jgi:putative Mn2+ efflux pump MntP
MKGILGIIGILGLFSALTLILPLLEHQLIFFPDEWTYTAEHFIIGGILTGVGIICIIVLFALKNKETQAK